MKIWHMLLFSYVISGGFTFGESVMLRSHKVMHDKSAKDFTFISLTGEITFVEVAKGANAYGINLKAKMRLKNVSSTPIIFLKKNFLFTGIGLALNSENLKMGKYLAWSYAGIGCSQTSKEWVNLQKKLDRPTPPVEEIFVLMPKEERIIDAEPVGISILLDPKKGFSSAEKESASWDIVKSLPELWVKIIAEPYPFWGLEPDCYGKSFGQKLQERWKDIGFLWLDDIQSEPIALNLKRATVR